MNNDQIKQFITKSRQDGVRDEDIVNFLKQKGVNLDTPQQSSMTGSTKAPFQATGEEGVLTGSLKTIGNAPRSAFELGKSVVQAVTSPIETTKAVGQIVQGAGAKVGEAFLEKTDIGQSLLQKAKERGVDVQTDPSTGKLATKETPELQAFNSVIKFFGDRYGSVDKLKETVIEDPAGFLADLATVTTGVGAGVSATGKAANIPKLSTAGQAVSKAGQAIEPISAMTQATTRTLSSAVKPVASIIPDGAELQAGEIVKALELTQGDLQRISKSTGNNASDFIASRKLIKNTPDETVFALNDVKNSTMQLVRDEIAKVSNNYIPDQIPDVRKGMQVILNGVDEVPGLEDVATEIQTLLRKENYTLNDVQRAKELIDSNADIYSKFGDTKTSSQARGLDQIRKNIRGFIENEVSKSTNGQTNIRQLNNDVATSKSISDAIVSRQQRALLRQNVSLSDMLIIAGGLATDPVMGLAALTGKKVLENPTVRLSIAKALQKQPIEATRKALTEIKNRTISPETQAFIKRLSEDVKATLPAVESGSAVLQSQSEENNN